jgi:hypothetical protein
MTDKEILKILKEAMDGDKKAQEVVKKNPGLFNRFMEVPGLRGYREAVEERKAFKASRQQAIDDFRSKFNSSSDKNSFIDTDDGKKAVSELKDAMGKKLGPKAYPFTKGDILKGTAKGIAKGAAGFVAQATTGKLSEDYSFDKEDTSMWRKSADFLEKYAENAQLIGGTMVIGAPVTGLAAPFVAAAGGIIGGAGIAADMFEDVVRMARGTKPKSTTTLTGYETDTEDEDTEDVIVPNDGTREVGIDWLKKMRELEAPSLLQGTSAAIPEEALRQQLSGTSEISRQSLIDYAASASMADRNEQALSTYATNYNKSLETLNMVKGAMNQLNHAKRNPTRSNILIASNYIGQLMDTNKGLQNIDASNLAVYDTKMNAMEKMASLDNAFKTAVLRASGKTTESGMTDAEKLTRISDLLRKKDLLVQAKEAGEISVDDYAKGMKAYESFIQQAQMGKVLPPS